MRLKPVVALLALVLFAQDVLLRAAPVCASAHPHGTSVMAAHPAHGGSAGQMTSGSHRDCLTAPSGRGGSHSPATCATMTGCAAALAFARAQAQPVRLPDISESFISFVPALHTFHLPPVTPPPKA
jgi:hypothetical protein